MEIIQAVIFMAGLGIENGIQIKGGNAQFFEIWDFLLNSLQVTAIKIQAVPFFIGQGLCVPAFHPDARVSILAILPGTHIVAGISIAEPLRKDLIEHRMLHPRGLHIVRNQLEIVAVFREIGCDLFLVIKIDLLSADYVKVVAHPVLIHPQRTFPVNKTILPVGFAHIYLPFPTIGCRAKDYILYRCVFVHPQSDRHRFKELGGRVGYECCASVAVNTFKPLFHMISPFSFIRSATPPYRTILHVLPNTCK